MADLVTAGIAAISLCLSAFTLWVTTFRAGTVKMTRPTLVFLGPDGGGNGAPKVYLRTLLYSTSRKGHVIESLWIRLHRGGSVQTFNIWVLAESDGSMVRGGGLKVGYDGITCTNHFLLPRDGTEYGFLAGMYRLEVHASLVNKPRPLILTSISLTLSPEQTEAMRQLGAGTFFDWEPDAGNYHAHVDVPRDGGYRPLE